MDKKNLAFSHTYITQLPSLPKEQNVKLALHVWSSQEKDIAPPGPPGPMGFPFFSI